MSTPETSTNALLASVWERNLPVLRARLDLLDQAAAATPLDAMLKTEAHAVAHKLAGSLGMFGYTEGTRIARELELLLEEPNPESSQIFRLTTELRSSIFVR
jgi:HPt (histidine-containing phosphotransfer) domain-containing protein